ncbi:MAG: gamma-glutamylcyclotransferase [Ancrocorticia sp.]
MFVTERDPALIESRKKTLRNLMSGMLVCALWLPTASAIAVETTPAADAEIVIEVGDGSDNGDVVTTDGDAAVVDPHDVLAPTTEIVLDTEEDSDTDNAVLPTPASTPVPTAIPTIPEVTDSAEVAGPEVLAKEIVEFTDAKLKACVASALGLGIDAKISKDNLRQLTELTCELSEKPEMTPLKYATNLKRLNLSNNKISDISVLKALGKLTWLDISGNRISDFSALKGLTKLQYVKLDSQRPSGSLLKDRWIDAGGRWYYLNSKGLAATSWALISGKWYYFDAQGAMKTGWAAVGGKWYYLDASGAMATGWVKSQGKQYYLDSNGAMVTGWLAVGGKWYYLDSNGAMATGWVTSQGKWYYFDAKGVMKTGWAAVGGKWYYLDASGAMVTGWVATQGKWYYLDSNGAMTTGWSVVRGKWYYFDAKGVMTTGWVATQGKWYYLDSSGAMTTGWLQQGNVWYYFRSNGAMVTGRQTISGVTYWFNSDGIWLSDQIPLFVYGTLRTGEEADFVVSPYIQRKVVTRANAVDLWVTWDRRGGWPWIMPGTAGTTGEALSFAPQQAGQVLARTDDWEGYIPGGDINQMNYTREVISSGQGYVYAYVATPHRQAFIRSFGTRVIHGDFTRF